jgi:hypothetical protein
MFPKHAEDVFLIIAFLGPGFVVEHTLSVFITGRVTYTAHSWLRYLVLSVVNYGIWSWLVYLNTKHPFFLGHPFVAGFSWTVVLLLGPVGLGVALGLAVQRDWMGTVLRRFGLRPVHPIPTAWDWQFGRIDDARFVLITLKDDSVVRGFFGGNSFASTAPGERDIYVEQLYEPSHDQDWAMADAGKGALIPGGQIKTVEFFPIHWDEGGHEK